MGKAFENAEEEEEEEGEKKGTHTSSTASCCFFNNAKKTPIPKSVELAGHRAITSFASPWEEKEMNMNNNNYQEDVRRLFAKLIGCSSKNDDSANDDDNDDDNNDGSDNIAICPSTGFALTMAAQNLVRTGKILPNTKILILQDDMSSSVYCWQYVCENVMGASLEIVPYPTTTTTKTIMDNENENETAASGGGWTQLILDRIIAESGCVSVVCVPHVHWADGSMLDLISIGKACRQHQISLILDITQSVGILPINVHDIQPDCVAASVHKWLLGPAGMSLVYIKREHINSWKPLDQHERGRKGINDIFDATKNVFGPEGYPTDFKNGARRCDAGGEPNPILIPMVREALAIVTKLDLNDAQEKIKEITYYVLQSIVRDNNLDYVVTPGPRCGHILGLRPGPTLEKILTPEVMVNIVKRLAREENIYLSARCGAFRISPYLNNTIHDAKRLVVGLVKMTREYMM